MKIFMEDGTKQEVPVKFEVCPRCKGHGVHDCWEGGMTGDEMAEAGPEFFEDYMDGMYSVSCSVCNGLRVVEAFDRKRATREQVEAYDAAELEREEHDAMIAGERRLFGNY